MSQLTALALLFASALFEAGGDALVRSGIRASVGWTRALFFGAGALVLFAYGWLVNAPPWDFGRLLGVYIVFFFVVAQAIAWVAFGQPPTRAILAGGALIVLGGTIIAVAN